MNEARTDAEAALIRERLREHDLDATAGGLARPGVQFAVAARGPQGDIVGGITCSTELSVMWLEVLWVADEHRNRGLGRALLHAAEGIGRSHGCVACQTWTFSWQGPWFYPKAGYRLLGIYEGYPDGITEHILMKRLTGAAAPAAAPEAAFTILGSPTAADLEPVYDGFHEFCLSHVSPERRNDPGLSVRLILRDREGEVVGGILASTTLRILVPEHLWVAAPLQRCGYGRALLQEAERLAADRGCLSSRVAAYSFQAPDFFQRLGYRSHAVSDAFPAPFSQHYLIKML